MEEKSQYESHNHIKLSTEASESSCYPSLSKTFLLKWTYSILPKPYDFTMMTSSVSF